MPMEGLKRRLSFRKKKKDKVPECSKPHQWQEDEKKVRDGTCSFQVRYLGCVEVFESRGMQVCEEAVKTLKAQCKGKYQRAILYVSGDALRVVDEISKSMIVDQTIEKVSFCAPDRNHEKGFAYICRDGTTRRWMCHGFLAVKESGERLSHAVGCAFAICLERKQKRDKETASTVTVTYSQDRTSFERTGSFRQATITERLNDPQSAILAEPVPVRQVNNPWALQRPHATQNMLVRQGSFRGFSKLQEASSPFKRTLSLRLNDLPSTLQRQNATEISPPKEGDSEELGYYDDAELVEANQSLGGLNNNGVIEEMPSPPETEDSISQMCQQLTMGLSALTEDPFARAPPGSGGHHHAPPQLVKQHSMPATFHTSPKTGLLSHPAPPIHQTNPWAQPAPAPPAATGDSSASFQAPVSTNNGPVPPPPAQPSTNPFVNSSTANTAAPVPAGAPVAALTRPHLQAHNRSHSMDTWEAHDARKQTLLAMTHHQSFQLNGQPATGAGATATSAGWTSDSNWANATVHSSPANNTNYANQSVPNTKTSSNAEDSFDPFDVAWAARTSGKPEQGQVDSSGNPFATKTVTTYKVEL